MRGWLMSSTLRALFQPFTHGLASGERKSRMEKEFTNDLPGCTTCFGSLEQKDVTQCGCKSKLTDNTIQVNGTGQHGPFADMQNNQNHKEEAQKSSEELADTSGPSLEDPLSEGDVLCDSCIESPRRARKSCLTCLVSYCEDHLRPHLEKQKFQSHRLVEPLKDVERRMCETHDSPLEYYCCADACCVCQECVSGLHLEHKKLPITEAHQKLEKELQDKQTETEKTLLTVENSINKLQSNIRFREACVKDLRVVLQQQVNMLQVVVQQVGAELSEVLEAEEKHKLCKVSSDLCHLEQHCAELKRTQTHLEKLSKNKNDIHFLEEYSQWKKTTTDVTLPNVCMSQTEQLQLFSRIVTQTTQEMCNTLLTTYRNTVNEVFRTDTHQAMLQLNATKQNNLQPEPESRDDFLKYASSLTFDCDTVHQFLRVTSGGRKVTNTTPWQHSYPEQSKRFKHWKQALAEQSFSSGRHYFEADLRGVGAHVGVTYGGIGRQGEDNKECLPGSEISWCVEWNGRGFSVWHRGVETTASAAKSTRIGVFADFDRGTVAFYSVSGELVMELLHQYENELTEPLYPAAFLPKKENVVVLVEPGEELPLKSPSSPCSP